MKWTCPGCSNACEFEIPTSFALPLPVIPALALPSLGLPPLPALPALPSLPDPLFPFGGTLPTIEFPWEGAKTYEEGDTVEVFKESTGEAGERKTKLTYTADNAGVGGSVEPEWGLSEVMDNEVKLILTNKSSGTGGDCPNSKGSSK